MAQAMALASSLNSRLCSQPPSLILGRSWPRQIWHQPIGQALVIGKQRIGGLFISASAGIECSSRAPVSAQNRSSNHGNEFSFFSAFLELDSRSRAVASPASWCIQPALLQARQAKSCIVAASSNEGDETKDSDVPSTSTSVTEGAKPSISEKRAQAEAEAKKGQRTAIVTGAISVLLGVGYLVLVQLLDTWGVKLVPPPPEAFNP